MYPEVDDYHLEFGLHDTKHGVCLTEDLQVHLLELPKFRGRLEELKEPLDKWAYFFLNAESMDPNELPAALSDAVFHHAMKELEMLTKDELERERYEAREKAIRDQQSLVHDAERAMEQGLQQGLEQGELIGRIHLCERRLKRPLTPPDQLTARSLDELGELAGKLEAELFET
jgi:predicted transposase/invertase (TIGR01784 family)